MHVDEDRCLRLKWALKTAANPPLRQEALRALKDAQPAGSSEKLLNSPGDVQVSVRQRKSNEKKFFKIKVLFAGSWVRDFHDNRIHRPKV